VNRLSITVGLTAVDLCWVYPWAVLLGLWSDPAHPHPLLSPPSVFLLVLLGALSTQTLGRRAVTNRGVRFGLVGLGVVAVCLAERADQYPTSSGLEWVVSIVVALGSAVGQLSAPVLAFALGLYLWWRGVRLGGQAASYPDVESAFKWGIGLLVTFSLAMALTTRPSLLPSLEAQTLPFVVGFFFVSLLTLALGRLESLRSRTRALAVNTQWLTVLLAVTAFIVLVALVIGQLLSFDLLVLASRPLFELLGRVLLVLVYIVVIPLAYIIQLLIYLVLSLLRPPGDQQPPQPLQPSDIEDLLRRMFALELPPELGVVLKAVAAALVLAIAFRIVARAIARWRPSSTDADATDEERDSVWEAGRFREALMAWLRRLFGRQPRVAVSAPIHSEGLADAVRPTPLASIRELYRQLLALGEIAGVVRRQATTPLEHLPALEQRLEPPDYVEDLTHAYISVRYAEQEPPSEDVEVLRERLAQIAPASAPEP
jgi:Domain of unknown function (DUF4129)